MIQLYSKLSWRTAPTCTSGKKFWTPGVYTVIFSWMSRAYPVSFGQLPCLRLLVSESIRCLWTDPESLKVPYMWEENDIDDNMENCFYDQNNLYLARLLFSPPSKRCSSCHIWRRCRSISCQRLRKVCWATWPGPEPRRTRLWGWLGVLGVQNGSKDQHVWRFGNPGIKPIWILESP